MSPYNALSVPKKFKFKSYDQLNTVSTEAQFIKKFTLKLGLATLIATVVYLPNLSQAAYSADLKFQNQTTQEQQNGFSRLFPRIIGLLPTPLRKLANLSHVSPVDSGQDLFSIAKNQQNTSYLNQVTLSGEQEFLVATELELNFLPSTASSPVKSSLKTYRVKSGDTVYKIAQQYQVNPQELIQSNLISNSDLILVGQQLVIPQTISNPIGRSTKNASSTKLANQNSIKSSTKTSLADAYPASDILGKHHGIGGKRPTMKKVDLDEDPYIAGLRADIERMRAEFRQQLQQQKNEAPIRRNVSRRNGNLDDPLFLNGDSTIEEQKNDDVATSVPSSQNLKPDLFTEDNVAIQLPPLPSSEEYLPSAFDGYTWPAKGVLTSGYGWRWGRLHGGIDIAAPVGTPVIAAASGEVISSGWNNGGYGNLIEIEHLDGSKTLYAHNNRLLVSTGQQVNKGEQIAEMGSTGYSTGSHLHFEIHPKSQGAVNPLAFLN